MSPAAVDHWESSLLTTRPRATIAVTQLLLCQAMNVILHTSCIFCYILVAKQIKTQSAGCHIFLLLLSPNNSCTVLCSIRFSDYWSFLCCCCWPDSTRRHDSQAAWLKRLFAIACRNILYASTAAHINDQKLLFLVYRLTWIAQTALPAIWTQTLEGVDPVDASTSVLTGGRCAVVDVCRRRHRRIKLSV